MLAQLIYVSTRVFCSDDQVQKIMRTSVAFNKKNDITGVLLFSDDKFLQVLEGESNTIRSLYDKIVLDPRHRKVVMISFQAVCYRSFPNWAMSCKQVDSGRYRFLTNMNVMSKPQELLDSQEHKDVLHIINKVFMNRVEDIA